MHTEREGRRGKKEGKGKHTGGKSTFFSFYFFLKCFLAEETVLSAIYRATET